ncbi:MAG: LysR family transcriptional regulator [Halieaceae bacterium]|nr:LysR family transcriptional regulator [Halieaceae bacterium]
MDFQHLRAFLRVAESGSFSIAADNLHLTQPAISKRIAQLEDDLGTELFDRIARSVSLTEAGKALLPHAQEIENQIGLARQSVHDLAGEPSGALRLATSHHIGLHRLPPVLSAFSQDYSGVHIDIDFMDSEQAHELIMQAKIDLALVTLSPTPESGLRTVPIWQDRLAFMASHAHPLASEQSLTLAQLGKEAAVLPGLGTYTGQIVKQLFDSQQLSLNVSMATNYLETLRMMSSVGLGWTVLPAIMLDDSLVTLPVKGVKMQRTLGVVYHRGRSLSRAAKAFIDALKQAGDDD